MTYLYTSLDKISSQSGVSKIGFVIVFLGSLAIPIAALYFLFRSFNDLGLSALMITYFILMTRDSYLERKEMEKAESQLEVASISS
jgi:hypothetical protein